MVTTTKQLFRPCCSCFFLGSVQASNSCSSSSRSESPVPISCRWGNPLKQGPKGQWAKTLLQGDPLSFFSVSLCALEDLCFYLIGYFLISWPFFKEVFHLKTWEQIVLAEWSYLQGHCSFHLLPAAQHGAIISKLSFCLVSRKQQRECISRYTIHEFFFFNFQIIISRRWILIDLLQLNQRVSLHLKLPSLSTHIWNT